MKSAYLLLASLLTLTSGCLSFGKQVHEIGYYTISDKNIDPGGSVIVKGNKVSLYDGQIKVGRKIPTNLKGFKVNFGGQVTVVNILPSLDTRECEAQTHLLSEAKLSKGIKRAVISRDLPTSQKRFATDTKLENIEYFSDFKFASFGKKSGLLMHDIELLTRAVAVVDQNSVVRYLQIVEDVGKLPDMPKAFRAANKLTKGRGI